MSKFEMSISMARRANKIVIGDTLIEKIRKEQVYFVIVASDASDNTKKLILNKCKYYSVECVIILNKEIISRLVSKNLVSAIGISDINLAHKIKSNMEGSGYYEE